MTQGSIMQRMFSTLALLMAGPALACSLCADMPGKQSLRQQVQTAENVFVGTMSNPRLNSVTAVGAANASATDFTVDTVIKATAARKSQKQITIPRYVPADPKQPPKYIVFADEKNGQLDPYAGVPVKSAAVVEYLRGALVIDPKDAAKVLAHAGKYLNSPDADVAEEAFLEFARANDTDVMAAAKRLPREMVVAMLKDEKTPKPRLSLIAYLLGACGNANDAAYLKKLLESNDDRYRSARGGLYAGLIMLDSKAGWNAVQTVLAEEKIPFLERSAAMSALRFFYNADKVASRPQVVQASKVLLPQADIADMVIEDLRRWKIWDHSAQVVGLWSLKSHQTPLTQKAIVRYALQAGDEPSNKFIAQLKLTNEKIINEAVESLSYENP